MERSIEEPQVHEGGIHGTRYTHPAFGQVAVHRVHSSGARGMYGSDFGHHSWLELDIQTSALNRDLSRDWYHPDKTLLKLSFTEAQWASFVSSINMGTGAPCTLEWLPGVGPLPEVPIQSKPGTFKAEVSERLEDISAKIKEAMAALDAAGFPKGKAAEVRGLMARALQQARENVPFVAKSFAEDVEATVEKAKAEVHGYMTGVLTAAGVAALTGGRMPLELEGPDKPADES